MYYDFPRPEVQALISSDAKTVLDVGCGSGVMGAELRKKGFIVDGVENSPAGYKAKENLDELFFVDVEYFYPIKTYDCIVFADVLEHLKNPLEVLRRLKDSLNENGRIIASIPNVAHHSVIEDLQNGIWQYTDAGILDKTHLRFFTKRSIVELFTLAGLEIEEFQGTTFDEKLDSELNIYQYLVKAKVKKHPLVSIVIPVCNGIEFTKKCYDSILRHTSQPYEIIIVDNGSTDGTKEAFETISLPENVGFGGACNVGITAAQGEYIVILNNDTEVTDGWLERLLYHDGDLIGPVTNNSSGFQKRPVEPFGTAYEVPKLIGFCLMVKKKVFKRIGLFDTQFGIGNFEDDDLCIRARRAGFKLVMAADTFIFHHGSQTFKALNIDYDKLMHENWEKFKKKYGLPSNRVLQEGYSFDEV